MTTFLCFRLHGPMASWGDIAVGEQRPSFPHLSRSAILGLIGAALGVLREDNQTWEELERGLGFASRTDAPGQLLIDFHTAQGPDEVLIRNRAKEHKKQGRQWHRPATRREELAFPKSSLSTVLSTRQYRTEAVWTCAWWSIGAPDSLRWPLEQIAKALKKPHFIPYLGRKSCPLDVPMEPQLVEAIDPVAAMAEAVFHSDWLLEEVLRGGQGKVTVHWEGIWSGLEPDQTVRRRDRIWSRSRWQFAEREEHQKAWLDTAKKKEHEEGGQGVSKQN